ncbi:hypothetical protein AV530_018974 [Patagioenas fasciata monilis]|uniref:Uncharacterized protein n=1 Tax=Patagioenas fasciata monilis TaxID=372326 RepID=A0A1V4J628_PATFA|nr:hypothetical protein AV530_018974 [Patagioenas fasciata monilis]
MVGRHELPAEPPVPQDDNFYIKIEFKKDLRSPKSPRRLRPRSRAPLVLWAGADQEETKKQVRPRSHICIIFSSVLGVDCGG